MQAMATLAVDDKTAPAAPREPAPPRRKPEWAPRIWEGCDFFAWIRLLVRNRLAVDWPCVYIAVIVTFVSFCHTLGRFLQEAIHGRRVRKTRITHPPIFILGHWRTGTTLLHEFLIQDERHTYPNTYECFDPNDFLITEGWLSKLLRFLVPSRRPMDNMQAGFERPQEDEFALCMMGQPSPYLTIAFPNHPPQYQEFLDLENVSPAALARWKDALCTFLKRITFVRPLRLVLKSPPHTCRIKVLRDLFPGALFVHIVRDPYIVFPSTVNMWRTMYRMHGLQKPTGNGLEEYVLSTFEHMYDRFEKTRHLIDPGHFFEVRYEELIRDPVGQMRALYEHLHLGGFDAYLPRLEKYLASIKGYETNRYNLSDEQRARISKRWSRYIAQYGY
jgi:hypothetical protein